MEVDTELIRLAKEFKKLYTSLTYLEIKEEVSLEKDNVLYNSKAGEFVEVLKVPKLEKSVIVALSKHQNCERIGKFPVNKLHYDLAAGNPYLSVLKVYLENLSLLETHLKLNPTSKIIKMMACVGLLKPLYIKVFGLEMNRYGLHFLREGDPHSLASQLTRKIINCEHNKELLMGLSKVFINALALYPLDAAKSPRSENDLRQLEKEEKELLFKFYIETSEAGITYLYDPKNGKPYYLQIFLQALESLYLPHSDRFDWREEISRWFFSNLIVPYLEKPLFDFKEIFSPRKEDVSPRSKERRDSITSGIERWRSTFSGSFRSKQRKSVKLFSPLQKEELAKYFKDIGKIYLNLFYPHPINVDEDDLTLQNSSRYLKFIISNFAEKLFVPLSPRPPSLTDYFHEIEEIYQELNYPRPNLRECYETQAYLDERFNVEGE